MYIHTGNRVIVSDKKIIGIFNTETVALSKENSRYFEKIKKGDKTIIIDESDNCLTSKVSAFTVINRTSLDCKYVWRRK